MHGKGSLLRKMPGDRWQQLANLRAYLAMMWAHPGKQLLFMGCEFGQESEWSEKGELDWWLLDHADHRGLQQLVARPEPASTATPRRSGAPTTTPEKFSWIDANDAGNNVFSFVRYGDDGEPTVACVANFSALPHHGYRLGLPYAGRWAGGRQHRRRRRTAAPASATSARSTPTGRLARPGDQRRAVRPTPGDGYLRHNG